MCTGRLPCKSQNDCGAGICKLGMKGGGNSIGFLKTKIVPQKPTPSCQFRALTLTGKSYTFNTFPLEGFYAIYKNLLW